METLSMCLFFSLWSEQRSITTLSFHQSIDQSLLSIRLTSKCRWTLSTWKNIVFLFGDQLYKYANEPDGVNHSAMLMHSNSFFASPSSDYYSGSDFEFDDDDDLRIPNRSMFSVSQRVDLSLKLFQVRIGRKSFSFDFSSSFRSFATTICPMRFSFDRTLFFGISSIPRRSMKRICHRFSSLWSLYRSNCPSFRIIPSSIFRMSIGFRYVTRFPVFFFTWFFYSDVRRPDLSNVELGRRRSNAVDHRGEMFGESERTDIEKVSAGVCSPSDRFMSNR